MLKTIADKELLLEQAYALKQKDFKPGLDGMTARAVIYWLEINGDTLTRRLCRGAYEPTAAQGFLSAKRRGGYRRLVKLSALDMVIQNAIISVLTPTVEANSSDSSYAYRAGRGVTAAVRRYCELGSECGHAAIVEAAGCFDHIDHGILEKTLERLPLPADVIALVMKYARMPVVLEGKVSYPRKGLAQGAPLSNLLCNLYLTALDRELERCGIEFIRYADDIAVFAKDSDEIRDAYDRAAAFLREELKLEVNPAKCRIGKPSELTYLGYYFDKDRYGLQTELVPPERVRAEREWSAAEPENNHQRIEILHDGILRQDGFSALFESEASSASVPLASTDVINIYSSVVFDSGFLHKALKNNITINLFDRQDRLIGSFLPNAPLRSPVVTHQQLQAYYAPKKRLALAIKFVRASIHNCRLVIRYYNKQSPNALYDDALKQISALEKQIKECDDMEALLMLEASVRQAYYGCFDLFVEGSGFAFSKRSRRPPQNEINAMLNFGNTLLYTLIATEVEKSPLDIRIGYLHATNKRRCSLNLDIAEIFKPLVVDRTVLSLINLRSIQKQHFVHLDNGGVYLNEEGKQIFLRAFYDKMDTTLRIKDRHCSYWQIVAEEVHALTRHFRKDEAYRPFKQVK